uniref:Probable 26S proteasome non-ATPase regulatory subunit 3-like n=1 Tax=Ulva partita TaxID=1605170 RepID=A0A1C9ZPP6_9CHLO|nr:probable 26S proteasome non-ATPase regulatory subunit 3-like [Ulva partita]
MPSRDGYISPNGEDKPLSLAVAAGSSKQPPLASILSENARLIAKAASHRESKLAFGRVLRTTAAVRSQLTADELQCFFRKALHGTTELAILLVQLLSDGAMQEELARSLLPLTTLMTDP